MHFLGAKTSLEMAWVINYVIKSLGNSKGVLKVFQGRSRVFKGYSKSVFEVCLKGVSKVFQRCSMGFPMVFQGHY